MGGWGELPDPPIGRQGDTGVSGPTLVERVAYLLWQVNQGYILPEDRAIGTNWFAEPAKQQHPDDQAERPGWIDLAETVIDLVKAEMS